MQVLHDVQQKASAFQQQSSPDTVTVRTFTPPAGARGCLITVETTDARVTLNGDTPDATHGLIVKKDLNPLYVPAGVAIKAASTAGTASIVNVAWLF